MKVYIVFSYLYSDQDVERVYLSKESADRFVEIENDKIENHKSASESINDSKGYFVESVNGCQGYFIKEVEVIED